MDADVAILTTEDATAAALSSGLSFSPVSAATATEQGSPTYSDAATATEQVSPTYSDAATATTAAVAATVAATTVVSG